MMILGLVAATLVAGTVGAYSESEWRVRPLEIIHGLQPHSRQLWACDARGAAAWKVSRGKLGVTTKTKLWGDQVLRLDLPKAGSLTLTPSEPIVVQEKADGLDLWIFGPAGAAPRIVFKIEDAEGKVHKIPTTGCGSRWDKKRWWGMAAGLLPEGVAFPIKVRGVEFSRLTPQVKDDYLCFDRLGAYTVRRREFPDTEKWGRDKVPFPVTEEGILPSSSGKGGVSAAKEENGAYVFSYEGNDAKVIYRCTPKTGTLDDVEAELNGTKFRPSSGGGIVAEVDGVKFAPGDAAVAATLEASSFRDGVLSTKWKWTKEGKEFSFGLRFAIKGKTLAVDVRSASEGGIHFDCGEVKGLKNPRLFGLAYLHNRWAEPQVLVAKEGFVSVFLDWYKSDASFLTETQAFAGGLPVATVTGADSARVMGGATYRPKTDGRRNPICERLYLTASPELWDVMPNIPNPPSRFLKETGRLVHSTRAYPLQHSPKDVDDELAFWKKFKAYGATDIYVRFHNGMIKTPLHSNDISFLKDGAQHIGGDAAVSRLLNGMRELYPRIGTYDDCRVLCPLSPYFSYDAITMTSSGTYVIGWDQIFRPKGSATLEMWRRLVPELLSKFPAVNAQYLDELSNAPPWADTDYDATAPGAGKFRTVLRDYGLVALQQKELFNGPIWSEGCAAYFWAGLLDVDYAVSNDKGMVPIVDFKLRKLNRLSSYVGADWTIMSRIERHDPYRLIAQEIACGNIGHLGLTQGTRLPNQGLARRITDFKPILFDYFMIRQVQEFYSGQTAEKVLYDVGGRLVTATEMLRGGHPNRGFVYAKYPNGLETWVNRSTNESWTVSAEGDEYVLPPNGHLALMPDQLLQYSALVDGHRADYSRGPHYTYMSGNGVATAFPELTAAGTYVLTTKDSGMRLTPAPFMQVETIKGLGCTKATPLGQDGKALSAAKLLDVTDAGLADLPVDGKAFAYGLE